MIYDFRTRDNCGVCDLYIGDNDRDGRANLVGGTIYSSGRFWSRKHVVRDGRVAKGQHLFFGIL